MIQNIKQRIEGWQYRRKYSFSPTTLDNLVKGHNELVLDLRGWNADLRAGDLMDSIVMASVARILKPQLYWEIGTGDGRTSLLVARNTPGTTKICTLDPGYPEDPVKGSIFRGLPEASKIQQFGGFSERFDFVPWHGQAGLVFVDGSHSFDAVVNDSKVALNLVGPGGWILWHDAAMDAPDVARALKQFSRVDQLREIRGTRYVVYQNTLAR